MLEKIIRQIDIHNGALLVDKFKRIVFIYNFKEHKKRADYYKSARNTYFKV